MRLSRQMMSKGVRLWLAGILAFAALMGVSFGTVGAEAGDCSDNAVIRCGAYSIREVKQKYQADQGNTRAVYNYFGIDSVSDMDGMVEGRITKDAKVMVDGKVVATDAMTAGRQDKPASSQPILGGKFYKHAAGANMAAGVDSLQAFVKLDNNGRFMYAVMKSCGNPVSAKPKEQPKPQYRMQKDVRVKGQTAWSDTVRVEPGAEIEYRVLITNTSRTDLGKTTLFDSLPAGITAAGGFTANGQAYGSDPAKVAVDITAFLKRREKLEIIFPARVDAAADACQTGLVNTARIESAGLPERSDTATVYVCQPTPAAAPAPVPAAPTPPPAPVVQAAAPAPVPQPVALPNTGPAELITAFLGAFALGTLLYRLKTFYASKL